MAPSFRSLRAAAAAPAVASSRRARILLPLLHTAVALLAFGTVASSLAVAVALKLGLTGVPPAWPAPPSAFSWDNPNTAERLTLFLDEPFPQQPALAAARAALTARLATALVACTTVGLGWGLASRLARCALARSPPAIQTAASLRTTGAVAAVVSLGVARFAVGVARARRRDGATYEQPGYAFEPAGDTDVAVAAAGCLAAFSLSMLLWSGESLIFTFLIHLTIISDPGFQMFALFCCSDEGCSPRLVGRGRTLARLFALLLRAVPRRIERKERGE